MDAAVRAELERRIDSFDGSVGILRSLVADLDAIWNLESWDDSVRRRFRAEWGKLEQTYATALERRPPMLSAVDLERLRDALAQVRNLLPT